MTFKVRRVIETNTSSFELGDIVDFTLKDGEPVQAMAIREHDGGMEFVTIDCLRDEYRMNPRDTATGGYEASELRTKLNGEILDRFPDEIRKRMLPLETGDYLGLLSKEDVFGDNCLESMKKRRNRIALQGENGDPECWWLSSVDFPTCFCNVGCAGVYCHATSGVRGVRPRFIMEIWEREHSADKRIGGRI